MKESKDILSLFEALNNHEIFTPPRVARQMLDLIPSEVWQNPDARLLDPCTKSGVFLREAFYRFYEGLEKLTHHVGHDGKSYDLSVPTQRINHILRNMLYGIATSELTAYVARRTLYGVMHANVDKQIAALDSFEESTNFHKWTEQEKSNFIGRNKFNEYFDHKLFCTKDHKGFEAEGNIFYPNDEVKKIVIELDDYTIEDKYFPFIDGRTKHKKILNIKGEKMKFDVVIGNPPYQISDGGSGSGMSAKPVYNKFIEQAIELSPKYITMITPSRWFSGGKGLDQFRLSMLKDKRISRLVDYENSNEIFPAVDIAGGVNYFLWDRSHNGPCQITNVSKVKSHTEIRHLDDFHILVRSSKAISIINKVRSKEGQSYLHNHISPRKPFGISSNYPPKSKGVPCWFTQKHGLQYVDPTEISDSSDIINKWKLLIPFAPIAGQTDFSKPVKFYHEGNIRIAKPGEVCSETYIVAHYADSESEILSFKSYLKTRIFRFLLIQNVISQNVTRGCFFFVPDVVDYSLMYDDQILRERWGIDDEEWSFVCEKIESSE